MDMEDLVSMGHTHQVCPFYYTRGLVEDAELVLVPYNYLFDKDSRAGTLSGIAWNNAVVIFDEAHNLESFASESASFDLSTKDIGGAMMEVDRVITYLEADPDRFGHIKRDNLIKLKSIFLKFEEYILRSLPDSFEKGGQSDTRGARMMQIFQQGAGISYVNHALVLAEIKKVMEVFFELRGGNAKGAPYLEHFVQCVKRVFGHNTESRCYAKAESYRVHITPTTAVNSSSGRGGDSGGGRTLSYWCFAPSEAMRELADLNVRSFLITSGTLSPLESYALELDLPFPHRLENPHIIGDDQIHVQVIGKGVSSKDLSSAYERRTGDKADEYYTELGNTLVSLSRIVPGGMLVFFPSYGVMETALEKWGGPASSRTLKQGNGKGANNFFAARQKKAKTGGNRYSFPHQPMGYITSAAANPASSYPWKRLLSHKAVIIEPRSSADLPDAIAEFHKYLKLPKSKGVALFGVCRGKISEGIDFAHDMCRAVIITGLPFAPSFDPKVRMKRQFLDQIIRDQNNHAKAMRTDSGFDTSKERNGIASLSGHAWYAQQAHRAVNQAVGRVIRNKRDYGAVILMDSRFDLPGNQNGLSKWVRPHIKPSDRYGKAFKDFMDFYAKAAQKEEVLRRETLRPTLKYEEEGKENTTADSAAEADTQISKIAFIDRPDKHEDDQAATGEASDNSPSKSFVHKDEIISTVDTATSEGAKAAEEVMREKSKQPRKSSASSRQQDVPSWLSGSTQSAEQKQVAPIPSESQSTSKNDVARAPQGGLDEPKSAAKQFFDHVQSTVLKEEFAAIKRSVVKMKTHADANQRKDFVRAASTTVDIILNHNSFENRKRKDKPKILGLFLELLPRNYIRDVQKCTAELLFRKTPICKEWKDCLTSGEYKSLYYMMVDVLFDLWFGDYRIVDHEYVSHMEDILKRVVHCEKPALASLSALHKIVPYEQVNVTRALVDELKASVNVARLKARENVAMGENAIQVERFRRTYPVEAAEMSDSGLKGDPSIDRQALKNAPPNSTKLAVDDGGKKVRSIKKKLNPYSTVPNQTGTKTGSSLGDKKRGLDGSSVDGKDSSGAPSLRKILRQAESDTYPGKKKVDIETMNSNAPSNLTCTVCSVLTPKPYINACGHMACLDCWKQWFERAHTCVTCRQPARPDTLALAVFKER